MSCCITQSGAIMFAQRLASRYGVAPWGCIIWSLTESGPVTSTKCSARTAFVYDGPYVCEHPQSVVLRLVLRSCWTIQEACVPCPTGALPSNTSSLLYENHT